MNFRRQLQSILQASGWSQEQLAHHLNVSFVTLNSWVNGRSEPRQQAQHTISNLYLEIVGTDTVDVAVLHKTKHVALAHKLSARTIANNRELLDKLTLHLTYHTNTIEGSTMTLADVQDVIFDHKVLNNRTVIEQAEARNHQATLQWLIYESAKQGKTFVIDEALILQIHLRLMNSILSDAGQFRRHAVRTQGAHVALANYARIPSLIAQLTAHDDGPADDIIRSIAVFHADFEKIHPFSDGNGRTGRLLLLIQALRAGLTPPLIIKERKYAYYKYLEQAQTHDNYQPLELFIAESVSFNHKLLT